VLALVRGNVGKPIPATPAPSGMYFDGGPEDLVSDLRLVTAPFPPIDSPQKHGGFLWFQFYIIIFYMSKNTLSLFFSVNLRVSVVNLSVVSYCRTR
jgi:hypothetical protein